MSSQTMISFLWAEVTPDVTARPRPRCCAVIRSPRPTAYCPQGRRPPSPACRSGTWVSASTMAAPCTGPLYTAQPEFTPARHVEVAGPDYGCTLYGTPL